MMLLRFPATLAVVLLTATAAAAQSPQSAAPRDTASYETAPVTVRAARPRTTPGGTSALEVAPDSTGVGPSPTLEQVLRTMPLVVVRRNSRGEAQPALRGGEDRQIAVLVDGVPITLAWDHRSDLSVVPLTAARAVTLHRGLSSLLLGPNALGGAVEVDIAAGDREDVAPPALQLAAGVDHTGARSAAVTAGALRARGGGHWLVRAGAGYRGTEGSVLPGALRRSDPAVRARLTGDGERRLNTDYEGFDGFLSLRGVTGGGAWASWTGAGYRLERGVAPEAHTTDPRLWRYPRQTRGLSALSAGTGRRPTPWGRGDLEASLGLDVGRTSIDEYGGLDYRTIIGGERDEDRTLTARLLADHTLGARGDLRLAGTYADVSHDEVLSPDPRASYRQRLWSFASEADRRFTIGAPVRLSLGAALDGADTPESADKPPLGRLSHWGSRAGATAYLRGGRLVVHASGGRRARFPALRELYSGALGRFLENPDLRPEVQTTAEVGMTLPRAAGELQLVGFHQVLDDAIARVRVATPGGALFQRVNRGEIRARGLEAVGNLRIRDFACGGNLTVQRSRGTDGQGATTLLEYEPSFHGGAWLDAPLPGAVRLGIELVGMGRQRFIDLDSGAFASLAPSLRADARLSRTFAIGRPGPWRRVDVAMALENAADRAIFDQAGLPQPGRTLRIQARIQ